LEHQHSVCGLFKQGFGQGELNEAVALTSMAISNILFSLIQSMLGLFLSNLYLFHISLSTIDGSMFELISVE
jgi:hypothetical protein